jgi:hypothetical protein
VQWCKACADFVEDVDDVLVVHKELVVLGLAGGAAHAEAAGGVVEDLAVACGLAWGVLGTWVCLV